MYQIIKVGENNLADYPQVVCFINPKNEYHGLKIGWLKKRFAEGLTIQLLQLHEDNKIIGFIEYVPGEFAWRAVNAAGYLFIHCMWIYPNVNKRKGLGSALIEAAVKEAREKKMKGVAVITSNGSFMAKRDLFEKNGFEIVEEKEGFQLLALQQNGQIQGLSFRNNSETLAKLHGWHIHYSGQCPWVSRFIEEIRPIMAQQGLNITIKELISADEAQHAPSIYSTFNLVKDGQLLADRYISVTRFRNILSKAGK